MLSHEQTKNGKHYWAISKEYGMLVVLKIDDAYQVCGPWECGVSEQHIEIIEEIKEPRGYEGYKLYYS